MNGVGVMSWKNCLISLGSSLISFWSLITLSLFGSLFLINGSHKLFCFHEKHKTIHFEMLDVRHNNFGKDDANYGMPMQIVRWISENYTISWTQELSPQKSGTLLCLFAQAWKTSANSLFCFWDYFISTPAKTASTFTNMLPRFIFLFESFILYRYILQYKCWMWVRLWVALKKNKRNGFENNCRFWNAYLLYTKEKMRIPYDTFLHLTCECNWYHCS